jgi:hypothetical protein
LRCLVRGQSRVQATAVVVRDAAGGAGRWLFFVKGKGIDVCAVRSAGFGAVIEDPDDLKSVLVIRQKRGCGR